MNTSESTSSRLGKIARLPFDVRQWLNEQIDDGVASKWLVKELNKLPEVRQCLKDCFDGRPINEQNLSAWKQGGYRDWQRYQQSRARARDFLDEAQELEGEVRDAPEHERSSLLDRVHDRMALALLQLFREAELSEPGPTRTRSMLAIARELGQLRRGDQQRQRTALAQERWKRECDQAAREEYAKEKAKNRGDAAVTAAYGRAFRNEYVSGLRDKTLKPRRKQWIEEYFAKFGEVFRQLGVRGLPTESEIAKRTEEVDTWQYGVLAGDDASLHEDCWTPHSDKRQKKESAEKTAATEMKGNEAESR